MFAQLSAQLEVVKLTSSRRTLVCIGRRAPPRPSASRCCGASATWLTWRKQDAATVRMLTKKRELTDTVAASPGSNVSIVGHGSDPCAQLPLSPMHVQPPVQLSEMTRERAHEA